MTGTVPCACYRLPRGPWHHLGHCCFGFIYDPDGRPRAKDCHADVWERFCTETGQDGLQPSRLSRDEEDTLLDAIITDLYGPPTPEQLQPAPRVAKPPDYVVFAPAGSEARTVPAEHARADVDEFGTPPLPIGEP